MATIKLGTEQYKYTATAISDATADTAVSDLFSIGEDLTNVNVRVWGTSTGTVDCVVKLYGSNSLDTNNGVELATFTLAGGTSDIAGSPVAITWPFIWFEVDSIGANNTVSVDLSVSNG